MTKKEKIIKIALISLIFLLYVGLEVILSIHIEKESLFRTIIKSFIGILSIIITLFNLIKYKNAYSIILTIIISIFMIADISINYNFIVGGGLFAVGHFILLFYFLKNNKFTLKNIIPFLITFIIFLTIILLLNRSNIALMILLMIYALLISFLLSSSINEKLFIKLGVLIFVISDALLMINVGLNNNLILGHFARIVYYLSIVLLSISYKENNQKNLE